MSLTSSMWSGVSGLLAHGEKMNVIGNNIANVNTIGFKSQRMDFADLMYSDSYGNSGLNQMGRGVNTAKIVTSWKQGPYESTTNPTDLAINGAGFFQVRKQNSNQMYYTRAGDFTFDKQGSLVDSNNYVLQGWKIDNRGGVIRSSGGLAGGTDTVQSQVLGTGSPQDVKLDAWTVQPFATTKVSMITNLSKDQGLDNAKNKTNPFAGLINMWDGTQPPLTPNTPAIPKEGYSYESTIDVYDEAGVMHRLTVYYDKINSNDYAGGENGGSMWEYIVTMNPAEDKRQFWEENPNIVPDGGVIRNMSETKMAGMLGSGTISFNSAGQCTNQSTYTFLGDRSPESSPGSFQEVFDESSASFKWMPKMNTEGWIEDPAVPGTFIKDPALANGVDNLKNWRSAGVSASGYPIVVPNFTGIYDAQTSGSPKGTEHAIELTFGMRASNIENPWTNTDGSLADMIVPSYTYNENYNPAIATTGPKYFLNNTDFQSSSLGVMNGILDTAEKGWADAKFTVGGVDVTFDDIFWNQTNAANMMTLLNTIDGGLDAAGNPIAGAAARQRAIAILEKLGGLSALQPNGKPLADTAFRYEFTGLGPDGNAIQDTLNFGAHPDAAAGTANATFPLPTSPLMQYFHDNRTRTSGTPVNLSGFAAAQPSNALDLAQFTKPVVLEDSATQSQAGASATYDRKQNGYGFGDLSSYHVDQRGVLTGVYSNGISMPLYQIVLYDFTSTQNLRREGGNVFSQTLESGDPKSGPSGVAGLGTITSNTIEQSNVDMAREFVLMITTQRGFQGNSKTITTVDTMLESVINMKR